MYELERLVVVEKVKSVVRRIVDQLKEYLAKLRKLRQK